MKEILFHGSFAVLFALCAGVYFNSEEYVLAVQYIIFTILAWYFSWKAVEERKRRKRLLEYWKKELEEKERRDV